MGTVTLIHTPLVVFLLLGNSEMWDALDAEEQLLTQERAEALGLCGPADYAGDRTLTDKGTAAVGQLQWVANQADINVMGEL